MNLVNPFFFSPDLIVIHADDVSKVVCPLKIGVTLIIFSREFILAKESLELTVNGTHQVALAFRLLLFLGLEILTCMSWKSLGSSTKL